MDLNFHFIHRVRSQAKTLANRTALRYFKDNNWLSISWSEFQQQIDQISLALLANHIDIQDKIGIFSHNMPRWTITDIGALQVRAVTVPIYATNTAKQAQFIINNADMKIVFVGDQEQYDQVLEIVDECPKLEKIVAMKSTIHLHEHAKACHWQDFIEMADEQYQAELQQRLDGKCLEDLFTLIYTSGTTGEPKGVMLDYANLAHQLNAHDQALKVDDTDVSLSFLPLSHIFERAWVAYVLHRGATNCYIEDTNQVRSALTEIRPTLMCAVPRFYEKIFATVHDKADAASFGKRMLFKLAVKTGRRVLTLKEQNRKPSFLLMTTRDRSSKTISSHGLWKRSFAVGFPISTFMPGCNAKSYWLRFSPSTDTQPFDSMFFTLLRLMPSIFFMMNAISSSGCTTLNVSGLLRE